MKHLPIPIIAFFHLTTLVAFLLFAKAVRASRPILLGTVVWMALMSFLAVRGFFLITTTVPPHLLLAVVPPILLIAALFLAPAGRRFLDRMDLPWCILIHTVRVLVEIGLFRLYLLKQVPRLMTFEGGNIDIVAGLSAPFIWWAYTRGHIARRGLLVWNTIALLCVLNALGRAMLSAPFRFQQFAFDQPTVAVLTYPFILLPAFIVPAVLLCHATIFRKLRSEQP